MAKYKRVFVCNQYADIPLQEPGWRMTEAVIRFPFVTVDPSYWTVRPDKDDEPVAAATLDLDALKFGSKTPWDSRIVAVGPRWGAKWGSEAAQEIARLIRDEACTVGLSFV